MKSRSAIQRAVGELTDAENTLAVVLEMIAEVTANIHKPPPDDVFCPAGRRQYARRKALEALDTLPMAMRTLRRGMQLCYEAEREHERAAPLETKT